MSRLNYRNVALCLLVAGLGVACDDADDMPLDAAVGPGSIADVLAAEDNYSMLAAAASRAGVLDTLDAPGSLTIFAPNNAAFAASGITTAMIEAMPVAEVARLVNYHLLPAETPSTALTPGPVTTSAQLSLIVGTGSGTTSVTVNGGNAVAGGANVTSADRDAFNGVIHGIDRVLLPPDVPALTRYAGLNSLFNALTAASLVDDLTAAGPFTLFAPTNAAFAELTSPPIGEELVELLQYHAVSGAMLSSSLTSQASSLSINDYGDPLTLLFDGSSGVRINGATMVVTADLRATNGVVHVVDDVIAPMNVIEAARAAGLTSFVENVGRAADVSGGGTLTATLSAQAPYTVFAPTNGAFTASATVVAAYTPEELRDVLLYHVLNTTVFPSPVLADELPTVVIELATLDGAATATFDPTATPPTLEAGRVVRTNIVVTNGVIHWVDAVLVPPLS